MSPGMKDWGNGGADGRVINMMDTPFDDQSPRIRSDDQITYSSNQRKHLSLDVWNNVNEVRWERETNKQVTPPLPPTTSDSGREREVFWMKLLEEQINVDVGESFVQTANDEEQPAEEDFLSRRSTLVGKEIVKACSSGDGSPLSLSSAFQEDYSSNCDGQFQNVVSGHAAPVPLPSNKKRQEWRRSFGDATNNARFNAVGTIGTTEVASKVASWEGATDKKNHNDASWIKTVTNNEKSTPHKPYHDANPLKTRELSTTARATIEKYLTASPPQSLHTKKILGGRKMEKVGPNPDDHQKFRWAYDTWLKAGLMSKKCKYDDKDSLFWRSRNSNCRFKSLAHLSPDFGNKDEKANDADLQDVLTLSLGLSPDQHVSPISKTFSSAGIQPIPSSSDGEAEEGDFQQLLNMWRDQSLKKQKGRVGALTKSKGNEDISVNSASTTSDLRTTILSPSEKESILSSQIKGIPAPRGRDNSVPPSPQRLGELSVISMVSSDIFPLNNDASGEVINLQKLPGRSFAHAEVYDYDYVESGCSSCALVILKSQEETYDVVAGEAQFGSGGNLLVRNVKSLSGNNQLIENDPPCECSKSVFSGNDDLISFFLPQMGMACTCGRQRRGLANPNEPTGIENVLRPWQCEFLKSFGISRGEQLVKAKHRSGDILARALRQWRKKNDMVPFKTSACSMALNIWAKTCKAYVRSIRRQILDGTPFLEHQPDSSMNELSIFLKCLPNAPTKQDMEALCDIEPESQVEV
ncbi:hypothetical protein IV203_008860 [Nitzschia inconspicua]|uniref:Uncharacterized protein n=1 Tax=Nitzschia inconspicua TaxID=303405 RepID=A0A9K3PMG5_9STRA|nr:hypothetical protein IV203_008860 [Nitzschia inconspicua]